MPATAPPTSPPTTATGFAPRRSTTDRFLLGVCGGLAPAFGTSSVVVRIVVLALSTLLLPLMLMAYAVSALILPADDGSALLGEGPRRQRDVLWAVALSTLAATCALGSLGGSPLGSGWMFWVLAPVAAVAAVVLWWNERSLRGAATWTAPTPTYTAPSYGATTPPQQAPSADATTPTTGSPVDETFPPAAAMAASESPTLIKNSATTEIQDSPPQPPADAETDDHGSDESGGNDSNDESGHGGFGHGGHGGGHGGFGHGGPMPGPTPGPQFQQPEPQPKRRSIALPVFAGMALIPAIATVLAAAGAIAASATTVAIVLGLMALVATLGAVAVAVVRPSYLGAIGLLFIAAFTGLASIGTAQFGDVVDDGLGERNYAPTRVSDLDEPFVLGAGELTIDLRDLPLRQRQRVAVNGQLGFGEFNVIVPRGTRVINARTSDAQSIAVRARANGASESTSAAAPTIELDLQMRGGEARVLAGNASRQENLEVLAAQSVGFWSNEPQTRP